MGDKGHQRWLWHALDHHRGTILADVLGTPTDTVCVKLRQRLAPCGRTYFSTDAWGTDLSHLRPPPQTIGKEHTQQIARTHPTRRTRIKRVPRQTICVSTSMRMHEIVMGVCVNRSAFGLQLLSSTILEHYRHMGSWIILRTRSCASGLTSKSYKE